MNTDNKIIVTGIITNIFPSTKFEVTLENNHKVTCTLSGKLRMNQIRISMNDRVDIELSEYDLRKGRIIWRHR